VKIVSTPTAKDLELTEKEKDALGDLLAWERRSAKKNFILGMPSWYDPENPEHVRLMQKK